MGVERWIKLGLLEPCTWTSIRWCTGADWEQTEPDCWYCFSCNKPLFISYWMQHLNKVHKLPACMAVSARSRMCELLYTRKYRNCCLVAAPPVLQTWSGNKHFLALSVWPESIHCPELGLLRDCSSVLRAQLKGKKRTFHFKSNCEHVFSIVNPVIQLKVLVLFPLKSKRH